MEEQQLFPIDGLRLWQTYPPTFRKQYDDPVSFLFQKLVTHWRPGDNEPAVPVGEAHVC